MDDLLLRLERLHSVLAEKYFHEITLEDIGISLKRVLGAKFCFCDLAGIVLYDNEFAEGCFSVEEKGQEMRLNDLLVGQLSRLSTYRLNWLLPKEGSYVSFFPVYGDFAYLLCLVIQNPEGEMKKEEAVLCEAATAMISMVASRAHNKHEAWQQLQWSTACITVDVLSYSERMAVRELLKAIPDGEGIVVVSELANSLFVARSVISSALRKLEGSEIITVRSLGVKGTYIRINNIFIYDAMNNSEKCSFEYQRAKFLHTKKEL